ncbi:hypothetical protein J437_LFUL001034 [Ladona fulva]|uniref:DDE-1 domain-containing protein n=1 Tax=Ladona fulva TaxID=123851 RepID=A0A8K0KJV6_LADFU|nr:hypothetical protein J437_LFUL001034 [Ladona fulva]
MIYRSNLDIQPLSLVMAFASHLDKVCDLGFPADELDFRYIVKCYLEKQGRFANNIKRARAAIDETVITQYVDNLSDLTKDVPPDRIYNYDETCMSDDPGRSKIICRRGSGSSIPPYIIYKAEHLWTIWAENGPMGTRYNGSKHGWIDLAIFEEWFTIHLLPVLKQQSGKKIVVGDNLSSHLSLNVVKLCEENDIKFVCLPPNSSHLTQLLDIAYFRPLKAKWRDILTKWKQSEAGKRVASLPKDQFPMQLRTVLDEIQPSLSKNLKAGFKKAGIYPANKDEILCRLPKQDRSVNLDLVGGAFLAHLNEKRREFIKPLVKKKKIQVALGRSITAADILPQEKEKFKDLQRKPPGKKDLDDLTSEDDDAYSMRDSGESDLVLSEDSVDEMHALTAEPSPSTSKHQTSDSLSVSIPNPLKDKEKDEVTLKSSVIEGSFVLVTWE